MKKVDNIEAPEPLMAEILLHLGLHYSIYNITETTRTAVQYATFPVKNVFMGEVRSFG